MTAMPATLVQAWDRASPRERQMLRWGALVVVLAVLYAVAWQPITRDIARMREALARDRATLALLQGYAQPQRTSGAVESVSTDVRAAVERVLDTHDLRSAATSLDARDDRVSLVLGAVRFDALIAMLDDLARRDRIRVVEARLAARVEPGTVRAELTLGR
ncbi:MAG TPA: type II secretion system protein GspM [Casimicrobiaceae bacterium]|jgi:general secretion pathway protein M